MTVVGISGALLAGCGDDGDGKSGSDKPFSGQSADQIAEKAVAATKKAESLRMKGDAQQSGGKAMTVDLAVDKKKNCDGTIRMQNARADVRQVGQNFYMRGDEAYWKTALKGQPDAGKAVTKLKGKWAKMPAGQDADEGLCDKQKLIASMDEDKSERKGMKKGGTTTVGGQEAIKLTKKKAGGETLTLYVATEGEPYILRSTAEGGQTPNTATFSDYGKAVSPEKPAAGETVDLGELAGAE
ncbi:hypothetical protein AB0I16_19380 [Streptomyces sp. NPDC050703]|uniref:hypothetical protein n=1 Tax=Streptomyces sp. NPDC050703 TaxID=3157218 RepID=UPI0034346E10